MSKYPDKFVSYSENDSSYSVSAISLLGAVTGGIILVLYFLIIAMTGYHTTTGLRFLNFILLLPLIIISLRRYVENVTAKSYFDAFRISFMTFLGSYVILAFFMILYLTVIDADFMEFISVNMIPDSKLTVFGVAALIIGEGFIGGALVSFLIIQVFKNRIRRFA